MRRVLMCLCLAVGAVAASAQQPPVFRTRTQHVAIDVVVTDHNDRPVTDLTKDDFEVRENGTRQTIADFTFVSVPLANRVVDVDAPPAPPSDVGSNAASLRSSRAIVVLVDDSSLSAALLDPGSPEVMIALKQALTRFLQTLSSDDQVAIVWQSRSDLSQDFTNDIPRLIESVNGRKAAMGLTPIGPAWRPRVLSLKFAVAALADSHYARRAIVFVGTRACNPVPGLSQSAVADFEDVECRDLYDRARKANVPIYALDPRVLPSGGDSTLAELAINTGGRHFMQQSSPLKAIDQIVSENGSFYTLGFYPEPMLRDGKYHQLDVTVKRPGMRVRSRDRYLADTESPPPSTPKRDMTKALASGLDDPSLPIRAFVAPLAPSSTLRGATRTLVTLEMTYPVPKEERAKLQDELRVGILALSPDAKIKASFQRPVTFSGSWKPTASGTFVLNEIVDLPSDELTMRVGVTSSALGQTGTAHVAIDVPDYRKRDLQLSPLVIGSARQPIDAAVGLDALRGLVPFQPTTGRAFASVDRLRVFALVYAGSTATSFAAELQIDDQPHLTETLRARNPGLGRREATLDTFVPLTGLAPGSHTLTVIVIDGKQRALRAVPFQIVR